MWSVKRGDGSAVGDGLVATKGDGAATSTIVWLHGLGDSAQGWVDAFTSDSIAVPLGTKVILPTATDLPVTINGGARMPAWYDISGLDRGAAVDATGIANSVKRITALISAEEGPVILGGFSQGGAISLSYALSQESDMANVLGIVAASAYLPDADKYTTAAATAKFLLCHGDVDQVIDHSAGKASHAKLKALGLTSSFHTFPGMGHSARPDEFAVISNFINDILANNGKDSL